MRAAVGGHLEGAGGDTARAPGLTSLAAVDVPTQPRVLGRRDADPLRAVHPLVGRRDFGEDRCVLTEARDHRLAAGQVELAAQRAHDRVLGGAVDAVRVISAALVRADGAAVRRLLTEPAVPLRPLCGHLVRAELAGVGLRRLGAGVGAVVVPVLVGELAERVARLVDGDLVGVRVVGRGGAYAVVARR